MKENMELWSHVQKNRVNNLEEGIQQLRLIYFLKLVLLLVICLNI